MGHVLSVWFEGMPAAIGWPGGGTYVELVMLAGRSHDPLSPLSRVNSTKIVIFSSSCFITTVIYYIIVANGLMSTYEQSKRPISASGTGYPITLIFCRSRLLLSQVFIIVVVF